MTEEAVVNIWIGPRALLVPWGNPLPNIIRPQVQVSRESSKWTNLLRILGRGEDHVRKDKMVIIWVPTKRKL